LPGKTEGKKKIIQPINEPRFELSTFQIKVRSVVITSACLVNTWVDNIWPTKKVQSGQWQHFTTWLSCTQHKVLHMEK